MNTIVFLDLDDTFWQMGVVPASARAAIRAAQSRGNLVFTNTGRSRGETRDLSAYGLDGRCYGAGSEVFFGGEKVVDEPLGVERSHELCDLLEGLGINYLAEGSERCFKRFFDDDLLKRLYAETADAQATGDPFLICPNLAEMTEADHAQVYKYSVFLPEPTNAGTVPNLPAGYVFTPLGNGGEITQARLTKASAVAAVRERLGEGWRTMAFGDSNNDIPMLRAADVGVCMGNGNAAAKAAADYVTDSIDADGLANAFAHFGLVG